MTAEDLIERLQLRPLPGEGGYYRETYRSEKRLEAGGKSHGSAIYFLITADHFSALHRLPTDEVWHFYLGDPVEQIRLTDSGALEKVILGSNVLARPSEHPQSTVPAGVWQGSRLVAGGEYALLGTTMAPAFDFADLEMADAAAFRERFPAHVATINAFTPQQP